jgi:hypothetical protein
MQCGRGGACSAGRCACSYGYEALAGGSCQTCSSGTLHVWVGDGKFQDRDGAFAGDSDVYARVYFCPGTGTSDCSEISSPHSFLDYFSHGDDSPTWDKAKSIDTQIRGTVTGRIHLAVWDSDHGDNWSATSYSDSRNDGLGNYWTEQLHYEAARPSSTDWSSSSRTWTHITETRLYNDDASGRDHWVDVKTAWLPSC